MTDDPLLDLITAITGALDAQRIEFAVTGSIASGIHGEPVASQDVDIVVRLDAGQAGRLESALPARFYRAEGALRRLAGGPGIVNLVDAETGLKVDLSRMAPGRFEEAIFARRVPVALGPDAPSFPAVSPEDVVLMKLDWRRTSRSAKQWRDALGVVRTLGARLDWAYLHEQAAALELSGDLEALRDEGGV